MSNKLNIDKVDAALKRAAKVAVTGKRSERNGSIASSNRAKTVAASALTQRQTDKKRDNNRSTVKR